MAPTALINELLLEAEGQYADFAVAEVRAFQFGGVPVEQAADLALSALAELVAGGLIEIGALSKVGDDIHFHAQADGVERARRERARLGRRAEIGEVCWYRLTSKGEEAVLRLGN